MRTPSRLLALALAVSLAACGGGGGGTRPLSFAARPPVPLAVIPSETLVLDANDDGVDDVAVLGQGAAPGTGSRVQVFLGRRGGGLDPTPVYSSVLLQTFPPLSLRPHAVVADADGDGDQDILFTFSPTQTEVIDDVWALISERNGNFHLAAYWTRSSGLFYYGPVADAEVVRSDANSLDDLAIVHAPVTNPGGSWRLGQYWRDIGGVLQQQGALTTLLREPKALSHRDINGDGIDEVLVEYGAPDQTEVYYAHESGYFWGTVLPADVPGDIGGRIAFGDLDGNGIDDVVMTQDQAGPQTVAYTSGFMLPHFPVDDVVGIKDLPLVGDLDRDGRLDLMVGLRDSSDAFHAYLGTGDGHFARTLVTVPIAATALRTGVLTGALADVNGDGRLDLVHTEPGSAPGTYVLAVSLQQ